MCLFNVLKSLSGELDLKLYPVHVNHKIRPGEAEADQAFVERLCRESGLDCYSVEFDCRAAAEARGETTEETGRWMRYEAFRARAEALCEQGVDRKDIAVALAHNADDQAETIMFRLMRGTGVGGLSGMAAEREDEAGFRIIRPLLEIPKSRILEYCREYDLQPRTDRTNASTEYARNRIRLELMPALRQYNPHIREAILRLGRSAAETRDYLDTMAAAYMKEGMEHRGETGLCFRKDLAELHPALRKHIIGKALGTLGLFQDMTSAHYSGIEAILRSGSPSASADLPHGYRACMEYGRLVLRAPSRAAEAEPAHVRLALTVLPAEEADFPPGAAVFDADALEDAYGSDFVTKITLRTRGSGDFLGIRGGRKKIQDLFVDEKIPKEKRDRIPLVAIGREVLFIPRGDCGPSRPRHSANYALSPDTKRVITVEIIGIV